MNLVNRFNNLFLYTMLCLSFFFLTLLFFIFVAQNLLTKTYFFFFSISMSYIFCCLKSPAIVHILHSLIRILCYFCPNVCCCLCVESISIRRIMNVLFRRLHIMPSTFKTTYVKTKHVMV